METDVREFKKTMEAIAYSMEIAYLGRLLHHKQICEDEYQKIKNEIMRANHVQSDLTAMKDFLPCETHNPTETGYERFFHAQNENIHQN